MRLGLALLFLILSNLELNELALGKVKFLTAFACDPCSLYNSTRQRGHIDGTFSLSLAEQYTDFSKSSAIKENSIRDGEFVKGFSTSQLSLAYDLSKSFGLEVTLPIVARRFNSVKNYRTTNDSDVGFGDVVIVGDKSFFNFQQNNWTIISSLTAGVKLPTGESGTLNQFAAETRDFTIFDATARHHQISGASGGRALVFGTGSFDYLTAINLLTQYKKYLVFSTVQYTFKTEGSFNYRFADDIFWSAGPGYYFSIDHDFNMAGVLGISGEFKAHDKLDGQIVKGSQYSNIFIGPRMIFGLYENLRAELGIDFRVTDEDKDALVVPDKRIRSNIIYRF